MANEHVHNISDNNFESECLQSDLPVLVDFWAEWCGPCKALGPLIDQVAEENQGKLKVVKVNIDENPETPAKFGVRGIPTMILLKDGKLVDQLVGSVPKNKLDDFIARGA